LEVIVNEAAMERSEMAEVGESFPSSFGVNAVPGDDPVGQDMEPMEFAFDPQSRLIGVKDLEVRKLGGEVCFERDESERGRLHGGLDGGFGDTPAKQIPTHLGHAIEREKLLIPPINEKSVETGPILDRRVDIGWKGGGDDFSRQGAAFDLGLVFGDLQP
jgi:hypothetical protein